MKDTIKINNPKYRMSIFNRLMNVKFHNSGFKTRDEIYKELKEAERQGKLKLYIPEKQL